METQQPCTINKKEAIRYYKMAAYRGKPTAMNNYANILEHGDYIEQDKEQAVRYYEMVIEQGESNTDIKVQ